MKRIAKIIAVIVFAAFIGIQFFRPDTANPPIVPEQTLGANANVPETVRSIFARSCNDCHSNETKYPWYSQIAPASWFLADHIKEGRKELNFSEWETFNAQKKRRKLEEICEQVQTREMPLPSYLWIHRNAKLSDEEIKIICDWTESARANLPNPVVE